MKIKGRVWKYGDDVNTDVIFPGKYTYTVKERADMAQYALEDLDPEFAKKAEPGDVIVAGKNWGCGSSREQAAICLKELGLGAIIARSFARIHYRNCLNEGLPIIISAEAQDLVTSGDEIEIDFDRGVIKAGGREAKFPPYPEFVQGLVNDGGLIPHVKKSLGLA
ncbi:MAG: 3-isopropylmalate dehydratase small subunit [Synergistaceae bacterium]|jgi:3-isopropylmalate/(R)-2-methylmalate dehydratase small subunit|nr:3-isopropylmalate dehydratase small subunit [Synergistaceae bacterium]